MERYILEALQKGVIAAVDASSNPDLPIKMVGRTFNKPETGAWLEVIPMPNNVMDEFWGSGKTYRGVLRLIFAWPMNDEGVYTSLSAVDSVTSYFTKGLKLTDPGNNATVTITDNPDFKGVIEEAPWMLHPVSIRYQFFKA